MLGFTEAEVRGLLALYRERGAFSQDVEEALGVMREWYNGYRFAKTAAGDLYNTDMVLYYLKHSIPNEPIPDRLIDPNVRIDYTKLRHLLLVNQRISAGAKQLNGNFDLLRHVIGEGEAEGRPEPELSPRRAGRAGELPVAPLLLRPAEHPAGCRGGRPGWGIPNQTVRRLMYGYLRGAYRTWGCSR